MTYSYRKDNRSDYQFQKDIELGILQEELVVRSLCLNSKKLFSSFSIDWYLSHNDHISGSEIKKGRFKDSGDYKLSIHYPYKNNNIIEKIIDIKSKKKDDHFFRFKHYDLKKCLDKKWPILLVNRLLSSNSVMRVFSLPEIESILKNPPIKIKQYSGKEGYILEEGMYTDWVDFDKFSRISDLEINIGKIFYE